MSDENMSQRGNVLSVRQLKIHLQQNRQSGTLLKEMDLELKAGEIVGLVGESGCGKTITANALLGLLPGNQARFSSEHWWLEDKLDLSQLNESGWRNIRGRDIAMIFQDPFAALDPVLRIGEQASRIIQRNRNMSRAESRRLMRKALLQCGMADGERVLDSYPHQLSGGMRQRSLIALTLCCQPKVIIADEPTSALDVSTADQVLGLLHQAARQTRAAILLITHDLAAVARICDRVLVMYGGRVVEEGPIPALLENPSHPYTAALLNATPRLSGTTAKPVSPIPGQVSALLDLEECCPFSSRCERADKQCSMQLPAWSTATDRHGRARCFHPLSGSGS